MIPATTPEARLTAHIFERVHGSPPAATRHVRGALPLLDGLHVPLPWGAVVSAGRADTTSLYSMNDHVQGAVPPARAGEWARDCVTALAACGDPGTHLVVNRELPAATGLLTGTETARATTLALQDLHGTAPTEEHTRPTARLTCNLSRTGLRLLIIDLGPRRPAVPPPADPGSAERAAAAILKGRATDLGPLLTGAHAPGDPVHDDALEAAIEAGALGGRTIGSCLVALAPATAVPAIRTQVTARLPDLPRPPRYLTAR